MGVVERKQREFRRREQEILRAARALFDRDDWQTVTIEDIAQRAEIGKGTVYLHFPGKEALYARLAIDFTREILDRVREIDAGAPVLERMAEAFRLFLVRHADHADLRRVLEYCWRQDFLSRAPDDLHRAFEEIDAGFEERLARDLEEGIALGLFPSRPIRELALSLRASLLGAVRMIWGQCVQGGHTVDPRPFVENFVQFALAGLRFQDQAMSAPPRAPRRLAADDMPAGARRRGSSR